MSAGDRAIVVLKYLREKHQWELEDFIVALVIESSTINHTPSPVTNAIRLSPIIHWEEVAKQMANVSNEKALAEMKQVEQLRSKLQAMGKPEVGLGTFHPSWDANQLAIPTSAVRVQRAAPNPTKLLASIMARQRNGDPDFSSEVSGASVMICSILARSYSPWKCNNFPVSIRLHLHSMGVKRRTFEALSGLGVTTSYWESNKQYANVADKGKVLI